MGYWNAPLGVRVVKEVAMVMVIPAVVQLAVWLRSGSNKQGRRGQLPTQAN